MIESGDADRLVVVTEYARHLAKSLVLRIELLGGYSGLEFTQQKFIDGALRGRDCLRNRLVLADAPNLVLGVAVFG